MPDPAALLALWERSRGLPRQAQALALLVQAAPELDAAQAAALSLGERDRRLLDWRAALFGEVLELVGACPACGAPAETAVEPRRIGAAARPVPARVVAEAEGCRAELRPPSAADLATLAAGPQAEGRLLARCLLAAVDATGRPLGPDEIPVALHEAIDAALEAADPLAAVEFALACPGCGASWTAPFDIAACLAAELEAWGWRTLEEVAALAAAFGWREPDVLALSPWRRAAYLELARP